MGFVRRGTSLASVALLAGAGGCFLTTSLDGLSSGTSASSGEDATVDGAVGDGAPARPPEDAGADTDAADASTAFDCDGATFCDSFERTNVQGEWDDVLVAGTGALELTQTRARHGTSALRATLGAMNSAAVLIEPVGAVKTVRLAFSFVVDAHPARSVAVGVLWFTSPEGATFVATQILGDKVYFVGSGPDGDGGTFFEPVHEVALVTGTWLHVVMAIDASTSPQRFSLTVDGSPRVVDAPLVHPVSPTNVLVGCGGSTEQSGPEFTTFVDDVRVDVTR